jgi:hypothetical protein
MAEESSEWRIDSLDARGGLAFASRRPGGFRELGDDSQDPLCAFIGAPGFQPEMVANRSIALAAIRGVFQYRLFIDEDEVAFPTLAAVTEFVRRVYLRGGGGDGAGGVGGEGPPPILPIERPDLPGSPDLGSEGLARAMVEAVAAFRNTSHSCKLGSTTPFLKWPGSRVQEPGKPGRTDGPTILANAATRLIYEMVRRIPDGRDPAAVVRWHRDARTLGSMISAMGLWDILWRVPHYDTVARIMSGLETWKSKLAALQTVSRNDFIHVRFLCAIIFGSGPALDDQEGARHYLAAAEYWFHAPLAWQRGSREGPVDPVASLRRIPLPEDAAAVVRKTPRDEVSLYHALVSIVGAPLLADSQRPGFFELVLFAATWIAGSDDAQLPSDFFSPPASGSPSSIQIAEVQIKLDRGWNWLKAHLPAMCFAPKVEEVIEAAADLRYELGTAPPAGSAA